MDVPNLGGRALDLPNMLLLFAAVLLGAAFLTPMLSGRAPEGGSGLADAFTPGQPS